MARLLDGNWEEPFVIGTRVEIRGKKLTLLWRNAPVLETVFSVAKDGEKRFLLLEKTGMRYAGTERDYAQVTDLVYENGKLELTEDFPISGVKVTRLEKTAASRYGNCKIADREVLPLLTGEWAASEEDPPFWRMVFKKDSAVCGGVTRKVRILLFPSDVSPAGRRYRIVDKGPSVDRLFHFSNVVFDGKVITADLPVCDAPAARYFFRKVPKTGKK